VGGIFALLDFDDGFYEVFIGKPAVAK
jgi:hypothetical protein